MRETLRSLPLERAVQVSIIVTIVGASLASASVDSWTAVGRALRPIGLAALVLTGIAYAFAAPRARLRAPHLLAFALAAVAVVSVGWSVDARESAADGSAFAAMAGGAALIGVGAAARPNAVAPVVAAMLAAIALVAFAGVVLLAVDPSQAIGEATRVDPARFSGIGGNPNTVAMLLAVGLPLAVGALSQLGATRARVAVALVAALFVVSIVASGSRGALVAAFVGSVVAALLAVRSARRRVLAALALALAFLVAVAVAELPDPDPTADVGYRPPAEPARTGEGYYNANLWLRLEDDIGRPPFGVAAADERPTLLGSSGRFEAWEHALESGMERPLLGFGFGQEDKGFTDRLAAFEADMPENSYLGIFLQLGVVGLALLVAFALSLARGWRRMRTPLAAGCAGAVAAGLVLAVVQSYVYAPGAVASATVWLCAFALAAVTDAA